MKNENDFPNDERNGEPLEMVAVAGPAEAQIELVLHGKANTAMPSWKQLSDTDIAAVITYTRNAWGNRSGQAIQPSAILAARGK